MIEYSLVFLAFLATLIAITGNTWDQQKSGFKKITATGYATALLSVIVLCLSAFQIYSSKHKFALGDIKLNLYAENWWSYQPDLVLEQTVPKAIPVEYAFIGSYSFRFDFVAVNALSRPQGYRSPNVVTAIYHATNIQPNVFTSEEKFPFNYMWELNGKSLSFNIPSSKFKPTPVAFGQNRKDIDWKVRGELLVGNSLFKATPNRTGELVFTIDGLESNSVFRWMQPLAQLLR